LPASARPFSLNSDPARPYFQVPDLDFYPGTLPTGLTAAATNLAGARPLSREATRRRRLQQFGQAYKLLTSLVRSGPSI